MRRKAVINTNMPGYAAKISLRILVETGENTNVFQFKGFTKFYDFTEIKKARDFASKYCDLIEII